LGFESPLGQPQGEVTGCFDLPLAQEPTP